MRPVTIPVVLGVAFAALLLGGCSNPEAEANRLAVDARSKYDQAVKLSPVQRIAALKEVDGLLTLIVEKYPQTSQAVAILGGQPLAGLSRALLAQGMREAEQQDCTDNPTSHCMVKIFVHLTDGYEGPYKASYRQIADVHAEKRGTNLEYEQLDNRLHIATRLGKYGYALQSIDDFRRDNAKAAANPQNAASLNAEAGHLRLLVDCDAPLTDKCLDGYAGLGDSSRADFTFKLLRSLLAQGRYEKIAEFLDKTQGRPNLLQQLVFEYRDRVGYTNWDMTPAALVQPLAKVFQAKWDGNAAELDYVTADDFVAYAWANKVRERSLVQSGRELLDRKIKIHADLTPECTSLRRIFGEAEFREFRAWADKAFAGRKGDGIGLDVWNPSSRDYWAGCGDDATQSAKAHIYDPFDSRQPDLSDVRLKNASDQARRARHYPALRIIAQERLRLLPTNRGERGDYVAAHRDIAFATARVDPDPPVGGPLSGDVVLEARKVGVMLRQMNDGEIDRAVGLFKELSPETVKQFWQADLAQSGQRNLFGFLGDLDEVLAEIPPTRRLRFAVACGNRDVALTIINPMIWRVYRWE